MLFIQCSTYGLSYFILSFFSAFHCICTLYADIFSSACALTKKVKNRKKPTTTHSASSCNCVRKPEFLNLRLSKIYKLGLRTVLRQTHSFSPSPVWVEQGELASITVAQVFAYKVVCTYETWTAHNNLHEAKTPWVWWNSCLSCFTHILEWTLPFHYPDL